MAGSRIKYVTIFQSFFLVLSQDRLELPPDGEVGMLDAPLDPGRRVGEHGGRVHLRSRARSGRQAHHRRERRPREVWRLWEECLH